MTGKSLVASAHERLNVVVKYAASIAITVLQHVTTVTVSYVQKQQPITTTCSYIECVAKKLIYLTHSAHNVICVEY